MRSFTFQEARECVVATVRASAAVPPVETAPLLAAAGRVLAEAVPADRDYPAVARSVRDGFAFRAADAPGELRVIGEVRAGESFPGEVGLREAVEIMTGAPVPRGADTVEMIENVRREGDRIWVDRPAAAGQFINPQGSEARAGAVLLEAGHRLDFRSVAMLASVGIERVPVYAAPRVALLATGDEIVPISATPRDFQIRNSNVYSLAAQVLRAGGVPVILPVARDEREHTRELIERGLESDLLLLSGGVSAGKYDVVEPALADLGAEFFFDRVLIQPGQPLVFGRARGRFFFGLPGNPASTMVTFEIFARAALELLGGQRDMALPTPFARLTREFRHRTGLTRFLPASLSADGGEVTPLHWGGSSDVPALARANAFLVADSDRAEWEKDDLIRVLLK
jgi:molybdopterin molybdotransferase